MSRRVKEIIYALMPFEGKMYRVRVEVPKGKFPRGIPTLVSDREIPKRVFVAGSKPLEYTVSCPICQGENKRKYVQNFIIIE